MNGTSETAGTQVDDIAINVPVPSTDFELIPSGAYEATLSSFKVVDKPQWRIDSDRAFKPDVEPDTKQWEWTFLITSGEYEGEMISEYTSRTWHEKSKAHQIAAALLGRPKIDPGNEGLSTKALIDKPCQIWINVKAGKTGIERSYVDKVVPLVKRPGRTGRGAIQTVADTQLFPDDPTLR